MSDAPPPRFYGTVIPGDHPAEAREREAMLRALDNDTQNDPKVVAAMRSILSRNGDTLHISTGPMSMSNKGILAFARPQMSHMQPLAAALGLDREEGWKEVWRTMDRTRAQLCKMVWSVLEWSDGKNVDNTYTYCFCTKYLPSLVKAILDEPSPSIHDSPYDLIVRGISNTPLLPYYLRARPGQAIQLRDAYLRKALNAVALKLDVNACYEELCPHLLVIHACIVSYATSPLSTPTQRSPPFPRDLHSAATALKPLLLPLLELTRRERPNFPWPGFLTANYLTFVHTIQGEDVRLTAPKLVGPEWTPVGVDILACHVDGCKERDPRKLKACSKCRVRLYCSVDHAQMDWNTGMHKPFCQRIVWDDA